MFQSQQKAQPPRPRQNYSTGPEGVGQVESSGVFEMIAFSLWSPGLK